MLEIWHIDSHLWTCNMFEAISHCSEPDRLFRTWSKHEAKMARSWIECRGSQDPKEWTCWFNEFSMNMSSSCHPWTLVTALDGLQTLEDYGVILIPEGLIECSAWSCSSMDDETCNTMPVTMRQSLCNYIDFMCVFCFSFPRASERRVLLNKEGAMYICKSHIYISYVCTSHVWHLSLSLSLLSFANILSLSISFLIFLGRRWLRRDSSGCNAFARNGGRPSKLR